MTKNICIAVALWLMLAGTAAAQDVQGLLRTVSRNMGADNLTSIQYSGSGIIAAVGQSYSPADDYPKFEVTSYTRTIDYASSSSKEDLIRRQGKFPVLGGGGTPIKGDQHRISFVSGNYAWNSDGTTANPAATDAEVRQLEIWLTPHGCIKAAMAAANATLTSVTFANNVKAKIVTFTALNKYRVNIIINERNMVERVQTWIANPFFGDMLIEHRYTEYKDYGGVKVPGLIHSHQGLFRLNIAHNSSEYRVTNAQPNIAGAALVVPDTVRQAALPPVRVESSKLADGVWLIGGGTHNSVAVEFRDFVAVVEAPLNEERSLAVIGEIEKLVPGKPIQYVVNTHHHFDHSGGLRTYEAQGATIVTHQENYELYEHILLYPSPRTLQPDRLSTQYPWFRGRELIIETVRDNQKYVISDGVRTLNVYPIAAANTLDVGLTHGANMLVAYLPTEKILINADMYSPAAPGTPPPAVDNGITNLARNIDRLKLDVQLHVPIHGNPGTHEDFLKLVGTRRSQASPQ